MREEPPFVDESHAAFHTGVLVDGVFWYWGQEVTQAAIARRARNAKLRRVVTGIVSGVAVVSVLVAVLGSVLTYGTALLIPATWATPSAWFAGFGLAALSGAFLWFRRVAARLALRAVPTPVAMPEMITVPSLNALEECADMSVAADRDAHSVIADAYALAARAGHADVGALHVFAASLVTYPVGAVFARLGVRYDDIREELRRRMATLPKGATLFGGAAQEIIARAWLLALADGRRQLGARELFAAAFAVEPFFEELFSAKGVTRDAVLNTLAWVRIGDDLTYRYRAFRRAAAFKPTGNMNRAYTALATPFLDTVSEDLTRAAVQGRIEMLVGRERELQEIFRAIEGGNQSVVLVGSPGVGKSAILDGIAEKMVDESVPALLRDKRLLKLSIPHIVSAQGGSGAEERLLYALQQVGLSGNIVLVIENLHELVGTGSGIDLSSILAGELEKGYTYVLGTSTPEGYRAIESSPLRTRVAKVVIAEPERNDAIQVLEARVSTIEARNHVIFTYGAIAALVDLSQRYMHEDCLPEKAIILAQEVALDVARGNTNGQTWVTAEHVAALIGSKTGVPTTQVSASEGDRLLHLEEALHARVIGQEHAVTAVAAALRRARVALRSEKRPIANFLFLGPTGVGKTELAKTTAAVYFGDEHAMIRFDMSEYQDQASVTRLIGGNGQAGLLTEAVRRQPFALLLLDELEKAHPDILNLFLQVMDDGRLTDGTGRTIDFTNIILIATSNAGTQFIQDSVASGMDAADMKMQLLERELRTVYRPEFLNRFDDTIVFTPLTKDDVVAIARLMLTALAEQLRGKGITFTVTDAAIMELAHAGYDAKFGARPLRRVLQERVENAIADFLLRGAVGRRDTLVLDVGGKITVEKAEEL